MFVRFDDTPLIADTLVFGNTGYGVLAQDIPSTGTNGASFLYNDITLPADNNKSIRAVVSNRPVVGNLFIYEDGSFTATGFPDGIHTFNYQLQVDGVDVGSLATVTMEFVTTPFTGTVTKLQLPVQGKILDITTGTAQSFTGQLSKGSLNLSSKLLTGSFGSVIPFTGIVDKTSLNASYKQLVGVFGSSISFIGDITKQSVPVAGKELSITTGSAGTPFNGTISKQSLVVGSKSLTMFSGFNADINPLHINVTGKMLVMQNQTYPTIPSERVFFLSKQSSNFYKIR